jgi:hypothetical protein
MIPALALVIIGRSPHHILVALDKSGNSIYQDNFHFQMPVKSNERQGFIMKATKDFLGSCYTYQPLEMPQ